MACIFAEDEYDLKAKGSTTNLMNIVIKRMMIPKLEMNLRRKSNNGMITYFVNRPMTLPPKGMILSYF